MLARLPQLFLARLLLARLLGALLLATIGLQAGAPITAPLERTHGSAFSASTHEVALVAPRRAEAARQALASQPLLPQLALALVPVAPRTEGFTQPAPRPDSTGPPAPDIFALRPAPRAPPYA